MSPRRPIPSTRQGSDAAPESWPLCRRLRSRLSKLLAEVPVRAWTLWDEKLATVVRIVIDRLQQARVSEEPEFGANGALSGRFAQNLEQVLTADTVARVGYGGADLSPVLGASEELPGELLQACAVRSVHTEIYGSGTTNRSLRSLRQYRRPPRDTNSQGQENSRRCENSCHTPPDAKVLPRPDVRQHIDRTDRGL